MQPDNTELVDQLSALIVQYSKLRNPNGGHYDYEAGYRSSTMHRMSGAGDAAGMRDILSLEINWITAKIEKYTVGAN